MEISEVMIIEELENIKKAAESLIGSNEKHFLAGTHGNKMAHVELCEQTDEIIKEYNWVVPKINNFLTDLEIEAKIEDIPLISKKWEEIKDKGLYSLVDDKLRKISLKCNRVLSIIKNIATSTKDIKNQFNDLKKEIGGLKKEGVDDNTIKNLNQALIEFEYNHLLSTVLVCGRIGIFYLDSIPGKNIDERIKNISKEGLLKTKGSKDNLIKANRGIRGLFAHDLNFFPIASQTLSIFGDTIGIVRIVNSYKKSNQNPPNLPLAEFSEKGKS